ncbi:apolipoprotein L3-like [Montipora foliosa]|uniref:apolipoprotein L3-like n=1 Tax=Montipora foliosa TaxID=591990 RepID=UPI0035F1442B
MAKKGSAPSTMTKDDNRDDVAATKDSLIVNQITERFEELRRLRMELIYAFVQWIPIRRRTLEQLEELATKLHEHHRNVNITTITGASMGTVGGILSVAGLIAAPFTFGAGIIVSLVGAGIGGAGGLVMSGSKVVEMILEKLGLKDVQVAIEEDHTACVELQQQLDSLEDFISQLAEFLKPLHDDALLLRELEGNGFQFLRARIFSNVIGSSTEERVDIGAKFFRAVTAAATLTTSAVATAGAVARTAAFAGTRVAHVAGSVISAALIPLDVTLLVRSSLELHRGSTSSAVEDIRQRLSDLKCPDKEEIQGLVESFIDEKFTEAYNKMNDETNKENGVGDV